MESTLSSNRKVSRYIWVAVAALLTLVPQVAVAQQARRPYRVGVLNEAQAANHPTVEGLG